MVGGEREIQKIRRWCYELRGRIAPVFRRRPREDRDAVIEARVTGLKISVAGGRHAMGGQQFARDSLHLDMTALDAVLGDDPDQGLLHIEAGAIWPAIIAVSHRMDTGSGARWGIRQKQTGADDVSLGGSIRSRS